MKRKQLSKSEAKELSDKLASLYSAEAFTKKDLVELIDDKLILVNRQPAFFLRENMPVPTLKFLQTRKILKTVVVDMGAVKFVASGADVMRPGIKEFDQTIAKDEFVVVVDINNMTPLAVCRSLYSAEDMGKISSGKVLMNIHHVGDEIWQYS